MTDEMKLRKRARDDCDVHALFTVNAPGIKMVYRCKFAER